MWKGILEDNNNHTTQSSTPTTRSLPPTNPSTPSVESFHPPPIETPAPPAVEPAYETTVVAPESPTADSWTDDWDEDPIEVDDDNAQRSSSAPAPVAAVEEQATAAPPTPPKQPAATPQKMETTGASPMPTPSTPAANQSRPDSVSPKEESRKENNETDDFATVLKERTRQRRVREDAAVSELRVQVGRLEAAVAAETKRRIAATKSVQATQEAAVKAMEERLTRQFQAEQAATLDRLSSLENRLEALEAQYNKDISNVSDSIQKKTITVESQLASLQASCEEERQARLQREGRLLQQLESARTETQQAFLAERRHLTQTVQDLNDSLQAHDSQRSSAARLFEETVRRELEELQLDLAREEAERQRQDEEIVAALNRYTQQLQSSVSLVSGV